VLLVIVPGLTTLNLPYAHDSQWALWLFIANWTNSFPYGFSHFWSLAVEEQFYLLWPLVVFALVPRRLLGACLWIGLGALLLRCALAAGGADWWTFYSNTACRMDALALGGAGACVLRIPRLRETVQRRQVQIPAAALLLFVAGALLTHMYDNSTVASETVGYSFLALSCAAFVLWAAMPGGRGAPGLAALLGWSVLRSCGKYSYGIYVLHNLLHELAGRPLLTARFGKLPPLPIAFAYAVVVLVASYLLAFCSYHALEKHFIRLKRFFYSR